MTACGPGSGAGGAARAAGWPTGDGLTGALPEFSGRLTEVLSGRREVNADLVVNAPTGPPGRLQGRGQLTQDRPGRSEVIRKQPVPTGQTG